MLKDKFKFELSDKLKKQFPEDDFIYTAIKINDVEYKITWEENIEGVKWTIKNTEYNIDNRHWIIKENK